jgi:hypothetical protein
MTFKVVRWPELPESEHDAFDAWLKQYDGFRPGEWVAFVWEDMEDMARDAWMAAVEKERNPK